METIGSNGKAPLVQISPRNDLRRPIRISILLCLVIVGHVILVWLIAWSEQGEAGGATSAVEIPVEMASAAEAEGRKESEGSANAPKPPSAIEPREENREQPPKAEARPQGQQAVQPNAPAAPEGKIVERPKETDGEQAARTRGAQSKQEERKDEPANPFGGLTAVEKPAPTEPTPTFLSPQAMTAPARPRPAQDPKNDNYRAQVLGRVAANMIDPERPRPKALTIVGFRVDAQGGLESVWIVRPSGHGDLDAEAVDMVRRSAPFPPPPAGAERNFGAAIAFGGD